MEALLRRVESPPAEPDSEGEELFAAVVQALTQAAIDARGGHPAAREFVAHARRRIGEALSRGRLHPAALLLLAKILSDSGWTVPESLKAGLVSALDAASDLETEALDLGAAIRDMAEASEGDPFALYDAVCSVLAAFPSEAAARMVATLAEGRIPVMLHALAGFVSHPDPGLAAAAVAELGRVAKGPPVPSALVERLVRMRPWLPSERQRGLDETIRALRAHCLPPIETPRPTATRAFLLACDGAGASGAAAILKAHDGWRFVAALTKPGGVEEVVSLEGLGRREAEEAAAGMLDTVAAAGAEVAELAAYLQILLGENVAAGAPPPFKLVSFVESLGLGPIAPRPLTPSEIAEEVLGRAPASATSADALSEAHLAAAGATELVWFEVGAEVDRLLAQARGTKARVKSLLAAYLPARRRFWARACALSALALRGEARDFAVQLALVARAIDGGAPMETIPLMRRIAEATVDAFESRA